MTTALEAPQSVKEEGQMPLLHTGDHMDRPTFHALYEQMPAEFRAELVGGVVHVMPAVYAPHARMQGDVARWLGRYADATPGVDLLDNVTLFLADDGEPQPDLCLIVLPERGGQTREQGDSLAGPPELVVEIAYTSVAYDLHSKKRDYERAGVREYLVVILREPQVVWFARRGDRFAELAPAEDGSLRSEVFPGLWLDPAALLRRRRSAVVKTLGQGCT